MAVGRVAYKPDRESGSRHSIPNTSLQLGLWPGMKTWHTANSHIRPASLYPEANDGVLRPEWLSEDHAAVTAA